MHTHNHLAAFTGCHYNDFNLCPLNYVLISNIQPNITCKYQNHQPLSNCLPWTSMYHWVRFLVQCNFWCVFGVVVERANHNFLVVVPSPKRVWFLVWFWCSFWCGFRHLKFINPINLGANIKVLTSIFRNCPWIWDFDLHILTKIWQKYWTSPRVVKKGVKKSVKKRTDVFSSTPSPA